MAANSPAATQDNLVDSGIARSIVFPNTMRDLRSRAGYPSLLGFSSKLPQITYTRLGKIERGEIFPRHEELVTIAKKLGVPAGKLFVDITSPRFDREAWALAHVEGKLGARCGSFEDMKLGATLRVKRHERGLATTEMKSFSLPAATVSRIEHAERTFSRWDDTIRLGIRRAIGAETFSDMWRTVERLYKGGKLDKVMFEMFSTEALNERHTKAMLELLSAVKDTRSLYLKSKILKSMLNDNGEADKPNLPQISLYVAKTKNGVTVPMPTEKTVGYENATPFSVAILLDSEVLGPGSPVNTTLIFEPAKLVAIKPGMVIAVGSMEGIRLCHVVRAGAKPLVTQVNPLWSGTITKSDELYVLMQSIDNAIPDEVVAELQTKRKTLKLAV